MYEREEQMKKPLRGDLLNTLEFGRFTLFRGSQTVWANGVLGTIFLQHQLKKRFTAVAINELFLWDKVIQPR